MTRPDDGDRALAWADAVASRLAVAMPKASADAAAALRRALAPVARSSWPEVAWRASGLAPGGMPLEFVWRPGRPLVGWTCEVAGPETPEAEGLALALQRLRRWGEPRPPRPPLAALRHAQRGQQLNFGAWLGGRHGPAGAAYKIYGCLPPGGRLALPGLAPPVDAWLRDQERLMLGIGQDGAFEVYGACGPDGLGGVAALPGLHDACRRLAAWSADVLGCPDVMARLRGLDAGWSLAFDAGGGFRAVALFFKPTYYALNPPRFLEVVGRLAGGAPSDAAWLGLFAEGLCRPGVLGLAAAPDGLLAQLSAVRPPRRDG